MGFPPLWSDTRKDAALWNGFLCDLTESYALSPRQGSATDPGSTMVPVPLRTSFNPSSISLERELTTDIQPFSRTMPGS
jgi:hypothetical protein